MSTLLAAGLLATAAAARWLLRGLPLLPTGVHGPDVPPAVSVVIPARNEAATLPQLLASLRLLTTPVGEVVVVDDGSHDGTASVARAAGATVVPVDGPAPGWTGKAWACHVGAAAATGDLLLFLDADTVLAPGALNGLLLLHRQHGGLVSVQPYHEVVRPYEQLSTYFNAVPVLAGGAAGRRAPRRALAFGPCLLTTRADYERAGGHAAVRAEVLDDVRLAAAYRRAGSSVSCALGGTEVRMRMYPGGAGQLAEGWTKNVASGAASADPAPTAAAVLWVAAHHAVAVGTVLALVTAFTAPGRLSTAASLLFWGLAWLVVATDLRAMLRRIGSFRPWTWFLFPAPLVAFDVLFARSVLRTFVRRSVRWRGREVRLAGAVRPTRDS